MPQKLRRMESSETHMSAQKIGITASSQNKSYNQPEQPESNLKTSKSLQTNNSDRKTTSVNNMNNRQTKEDRGNYKPCKEYDAALSLFMKKLIYAEAQNELLMEGPATPEPKFRWFKCRLYKPYATKRNLNLKRNLKP